MPPADSTNHVGADVLICPAERGSAIRGRKNLSSFARLGS
jgi:hypothetical protein